MVRPKGPAMTDPVFSGVDLQRYGSWIDRIVGTDLAIAFCDLSGSPLWVNQHAHADRLRALLAEPAQREIVWSREPGSLQRHDINGDASLLHLAVRAINGIDLGGVMVLTDPIEPGVGPGALAQIETALLDVAAMVRDDNHSQHALKGLTAELSDRYEELHLVYALNERVRSSKVSPDVFQDITDICADYMGVDVAAFISKDDRLATVTSRPTKPIHNLDLVLVEMRGDLFRFVSARRDSLVLNDADDPKRPYVFTDMPYKLVAAPVIRNNLVAGMLVLLNHAGRPDFSNSDRKLTEIMADQLANLLVVYGLLKEQRVFVQQMANALIEAVEAKDPYTRGHSERVHHIAMEIGRAIGLPESELENLFWASLLHDVGKIGIPDAVLCKPAALTADEFTFVKVHPERSYEILQHIDQLKGSLEGARHHQEKYDGTGYPHRLKGKAIPLHSRIIAVADTYDSITSSRAYRPGRSHEEALSEIQRVAGTQLDPDIVATFLGLCQAEPDWMRTFSIRREVASG